VNIFKILSSGDGSIKEPNVSAFLGYLLDPNKEHGLKDYLLKIILEKLNENNVLTSLMINENIVNLTNDSNFKVEVELEKKVIINSGNKRDIDIVIKIFKDTKLIFILCIENKIKVSSVTKNQLKEQLEGIRNEKVANIQEIIDTNSISFVYLTPTFCLKCEEEYKDFKDYHNDIPSIHLSWNKDIYESLVDMLVEESKGEIEPIFEYSKYTIKAFMNFIKTDFQSYKEEKSNINKKDNTRYNFNGKTNLTKGKLVLEVFKKYTDSHTTITYNELNEYSKIFRNSRVIERLSIVENRAKRERQRYSTKDNEIIKLNDGTKVVIHAGWSSGGDDFKRVLEEAKRLDNKFKEVH
jgi:galactitol-specific phosphotransferase system IIB component